MTINISKYIDITSGVGAGAVVPGRQLIGRLFSNNPLIPTQSNFIEFSDAEEVGVYFGTSSEEYTRALFYFSWISKNITRAKKISYARWVDAAVPPRIYGNTNLAQSNWASVTAGSFSLTIGGVTNTFTGLDFSSTAGSLSAVAAILQTAVRTGTGTQWTAATVTWDAVRASFQFVGGSAVAATISVTEGVAGTPIANKIGWLTGTHLIISNGAAIETVSDALQRSSDASNNFGSFLFIPTLTLDNIIISATWNKNQNVAYQYFVPVTTANAPSYSAALFTIGGTGLILSDIANQYPEQIPMMILATTNYNVNNSVQNYMFQQFPGITPGVTDTTISNNLDTERVNYYGRTQTAGQFLDFFQRGLLMGSATDPIDMNVYANEQWLKDAITATILTVFLSLSEIPANSQGRSQLLTVIQNVINQALLNGTISVGKILTTAQKLYITELTNDPNAWYQVQNTGYWLNGVIDPVIIGSTTEYRFTYRLVYSKNDVIRMVEGTDVLI